MKNLRPGNAEAQRLAEDAAGRKSWKLWGPYLSERQWGTVREDYSPGGDAWDYCPHDHARSRAYRWGEDGIGGISDGGQRLCLALALWNGHDPILKERLFGLTNPEGNHGEDVKEVYYYLDATPTHSYLKMLYKYPQREFPYAQLVQANRSRDREEPEFELFDTGIFDDDRYFDVFIEYAKAGPEDILMRITIHNRGPEEAAIHVLAQLWFRNTWSWKPGAKKPALHEQDGNIVAEHEEIGVYRLHADRRDELHESPADRKSGTRVTRPSELLFCDNETNVRRLYGQNETRGFFKDAFHEYIVQGNHAAVDPERVGTKAGVLYKLAMAPGASASARLRLIGQAPRLSQTSPGSAESNQGRRLSCFHDFAAILSARLREADAFYATLQHDIADADARNVQRQALAGMLWGKQYYGYNVREWLHGDPGQPPPPPERKHGRNAEWTHVHNACVMSVPDKWEYPWYAAWDLAFHGIPLALVDAEFAKHQLTQLTREWYMHPNGQFPAYEWEFGDVNPPVHAWATWRVFQIDRKQRR